MPFVPYPGPGRWSIDIPFSVRTGIRSLGRWSFVDSSGVKTRKTMKSTAVRTGGSKVVKTFGKWSPCRPYARTATLVTLLGDYEWAGNGPTVDLSTRQTIHRGYPAIAPADPSGIGAIGGEATGGLFVTGLPVLGPDLSNRLIAECMRKVADRKVNYGESLAESRKTLTHLAKTSSSLFRAILALRKGNFRRFASALGISKKRFWTGKTVSERWLEYQYAWLPLMSDIYDTSELLSEGLTRNGQLLSATRVITDSRPYESSSGWTVLRGTAKASYRCKLFYRLDNPSIDALSRLGLINPLEVAWAVVPFSFVIDWVIPIGTLLEAYSATLGLSFVDGCISMKGEILASGVHDKPNYAYYLDGSRFRWIMDHVGFQRVTCTATPLPYFKSPFSTTHLASAVALARQLRR